MSRFTFGVAWSSGIIRSIADHKAITRAQMLGIIEMRFSFFGSSGRGERNY
jgi:hypothetical protein